MASICEVPIISGVCSKVGEGAASLVEAPFNWLAQAAGEAAVWLFQSVWTLFDTTTLVDITGDGYLAVYNIVFGIAVLLTFAFFCLQLLTSVIRREPAGLARAATGMAKSILGAFVLVTITATLLEIVDRLCIGIIQATGTTLDEMGDKIGALVKGLTAVHIAAPGASAIIIIFLSFLAMTAAAIVWFSLLVRKALILILVVLGPIALAGANWDVTRGWFGKWATFVLALIISKFVVVLVFLVAITQVNAPIDSDLASIADPVAGIVLMFIAGFAPYMCYKLLAFAGADMYQLSSTEQEAKQSMNRPLPVSHKPNAAKQVLGDNDKGDPSGGGGGKQATPDAAKAGTGKSTTAATGPGSAGAKTGTTAAGTGTGTGTSAMVGPAGLAAVGVALIKSAAEAGPKAGAAVEQAAEGHSDSANEGATAPPTSRPQNPAPTSPPQPPASPSDTTGSKN